MTIFSFKRREDKKIEKFARAIAVILNEICEIRSDCAKLTTLAEQIRDFMTPISDAFTTSVRTQIDLLKKMEKFFEVEIKWIEEQRKRARELEPTEDDKVF